MANSSPGARSGQAGPWHAGQEVPGQPGPGLVKQYDNLLFDPHVHHRWVVPDTVQLSDFLDEAQRSGVTVVGEVGWKRPEQITTRLDQNDRLAGIGFYQARVPAVGVVAWHGAVQHLTLIDGSRGRNIWAYEDASALTDFGRFHWDLAHGPPPADLRADTS